MGYCVASGGNFVTGYCLASGGNFFWLLCGELWYILVVIVWREVVICYGSLCGEWW
jgi:hypothetical protein